MGLYLWGLRQQARAEGRSAALASLGAVLSLIAATALAGIAATQPAATATAESTTLLPSRPWSAAAVAAAQGEGRPVLVNFTADWCVTCKINERTSLSSTRVAEAMTETNAVYLVGDWTSRDDAITRELERHGRSGVPLYLVFRPGQAEPEILPQLLTEGVVIDALKP
jgi:thiol:disulfide interchange protein DsbD